MTTHWLDTLLFGIYPYICLAVFFIGSWARFDRDQYTWKSDSSQLLRTGSLRWGSNLFHVGVLFLFFGHTFGMLTPHFVYEHFISAGNKQLMAMVTGGIAGLLAFVGQTYQTGADAWQLFATWAALALVWALGRRRKGRSG